MTEKAKQFLGFDDGTIEVVVLSGKRIRSQQATVKEGKATLSKDIIINFKVDQIGSVFLHRPRRFRGEWRDCILWREGSNDAINWGNPDDFIPPLTEEENAEMIKQQIARAKAHDKDIISTPYFIILMVMLGICVAVGILNLLGVQILVPHETIKTVITNTTITATATPPLLHP